MWPTLINCDGLASFPFNLNPIAKHCHGARLSPDVPLEPFMVGDTCRGVIDLASEVQRAPWAPE